MGKRKAFVLISGGIDSTTALAIASLEYIEVEGVSIDYGQRHKKEMECARIQCRLFGATHSIIDAHNLLGHSMLTDAGWKIPDIKYDEIEGVSPTYVPFRNGTLLSLITARAQNWLMHDVRLSDGVKQNHEAVGVYIGAHAEDAHNWAYPDCTPEFIGAMANAIYVGTYHKVRLHAPLMWLQKAQIVELGNSLGVQFKNTWSCYAGGDLHCGKCPTCYSRRDAFSKAGVEDPTQYAA
jgi:7-cyano-7-deazaguanine synthase